MAPIGVRIVRTRKMLSDNAKLCLEKGVNGYPTWIFPDGKKLEGEQGLQRLSEESGCSLVR